MNDLKNIFIGMILGVSNIIPGVSAGTMAVVIGIYGKLIDSISGIFKNFKNNFRFLFFIGIGVLGGVIFFSNIIKKLLDRYPSQMNYLFMGLIIGGVGVLFREIKIYKSKKSDYVYFLITFLILVVMKFLYVNDGANIISEINFKNLVYLFLSGFIAAGAMVIPGVSGSFILILFGMYNSIISALSNFNIIILFPFGVGVLVGIIVMIKVIEFFIKKFKVRTYMAIIGLVIGSVFSIFPGFEFSIIGISYIAMFLFGFLISFYIPKLNSKNKF